MSYVESFYNRMRERHDYIVEQLNGDMPGRHIDEMSIYLNNVDDLEELLALADMTGVMQNFNSVSDIVQQMIDGKYTDDSASFGVQFEFLQPDDTDYRVEAMLITNGFSPIHSHLKNGESVHASFKCADEADYGMAKLELVQKGYGMLGEFRNTYGLFSYFVKEFAGTPYIKPRVNLRDVKE